MKELFTALTEDEPVVPDQREQFIRLCEEAVSTHAEFAPLLNTIIKAANYLRDGEELVDANISNVMVRPSTGAIMWSDPIHDSAGNLIGEQEARLDALRQQISAIAAVI